VTDSAPLAIDLDAIGSTHPLWSAWLESVSAVLAIEPAALPQDRGEAAAALDAAGAGNWRTLLERFAEDHAPAYLRRDAATSAVLRSLAAQGVALGVFSDAPEPLTRVAVAQLGAERRASVVESGSGALERVVAVLGPDTVVVRTRDDLLSRP
jgi:phosphoglycolate phosphatase-like HAD superfamily hydrolase